MNEFPRVKFDLPELTVYWGLRKEGEVWADAGTPPFDAYWHYIAFFHWLPRPARYWGYGHLGYDGQQFEHFGLWFFNISWTVPGSYDRARRRQERETAENGTPTQ